MRLALIRHTAVAAEGICYGQREVPLADDFSSQAETIRATLPFSPDHLISSPSRRCRELASRLVTGWTADRRWLELDFGQWDGLPWKEIPRAALDAWAEDPMGFVIPGGESYRHVIDRVSEALRDLERLELQRVAVVTHGGPIRAALSVLGIYSPEQALSRSVPFGSIHTARL